MKRICRIIALILVALLCFAGYAEETTIAAEQEGASASAYLPMEKGAKGDEVTALQERLNELGYNLGKADGDFGKKTYNAVCDFQRDNDLEANGIVDAELYDLIFSADVKTKAEVEALRNSPEGFQLDIAAAKAIGDKFAAGKVDAADTCYSEERSSSYKFYVSDYDTKNGELTVRCELDKAKGVDNIDVSIYIDYTIPIWSGLWNSEPNMVVLSNNKDTYKIPNYMWSWNGGALHIDLSKDLDLFKKLAGANSFNIVLSNTNPATLTAGSFSKNSLGFKGLKTAWKIWEAADCKKMAELKHSNT